MTPSRPDKLIIVTERLRLRPWQESDIAPYSQINQDPLVMQHLRGVRLAEESRQHVADYRESLASYGYGNLAAELLETGQFVGCFGLSNLLDYMPIAPAVDIGWRLDRAFWGQGLASEAARACLADGLNRVGLKRIIAYTSTRNQRSISVMKAIGMTQVPNGDFNHPMIATNDPDCRHVLYEILA